MDDCTLEKLSVKPGKLSPNFNKNGTEYNVTVPSSVEKILFNPLTSDTGASYFVHGGGGEKEVPLKEGVITDVKIEVTSEDGTTMNYFIHVKRLSAKDATLSDIKLSTGYLQPAFSPDVFEYSCLLPCNVASVTVKPTAPDTKNVVEVCGEKPGTATPLNVGETNIGVQVTSADGSNKQLYSIDVMRKQVPRYAKLTDPELAMQFECPYTLSPLYRPISIRGSEPKHTYSAPNLEERTRTVKVDPLSGMPLGSDWKIIDYEIDKKIATAVATMPLSDGTSPEPCKYGELAAQIQKCNITPKVQDVKDKFKDVSVPVNHTVQIPKWEKNLQQIYDITDVGKLTAEGEKSIQKYFNSLPKSGQSRQWPDGESPLDYLEKAAIHYATAIKHKPKDAALHLKLGMVLEERYYAEDMFSIKKEETGLQLPSFNLEAKESSKEEECDAICKLRGVDASSAPIALQLKAIDEEYHHLVNSGQSGKADHVQSLYVWKSKQASQEGAAAQKAQDQQSPLGQAYIKYMDALALDEAKAVYNYHVGRLLVIQGNFDDALKRLEVTLNWNSNHQLARFYLGLALALQKNGPGARAKETIGYLLEAMETLLTENTKAAMTPDDPRDIEPILHAENLLRSTNVHLLRGIVQLGKLLQQNSDVKDCMFPQDVFHTSALLSSQVLPFVARGDTYKQLEWVLLESHTALLDILTSAKQNVNEKLVEQRCQRLLALIINSTLPLNEDLLSLQEKTCQKLVNMNPCRSQSLYLLGVSQFAKYENCPAGDRANQILKECISSYLACIDMEGKPASGDLPEKLTGQDWWQAKIKAEEEKRKAEEAKNAPPKAAAAGKPGATKTGAPPVRGGAAARGARGAPAARGRGAVAAPARGGAARGGAAARGAPAAKGPAGKTTAPAAKAPAGKPSGHVCEASPAKSDNKAAEKIPDPPKEETKAPEDQKPPADSKPAPINRKSHHPRLGLARAYKCAEDIAESKKFYNEVMTMAPEIHDACIELAEMLAKSEPMGAVDVYCKFHISDPPTFDDAYILGEIVRLLMKAEAYKDPRLAKNMILYGKVYGLAVLEKYVKTLEEKFVNKLLQEVYAGVNNKDVDDPEMQAFFKFRCWV